MLINENSKHGKKLIFKQYRNNPEHKGGWKVEYICRTQQVYSQNGKGWDKHFIDISTDLTLTTLVYSCNNRNYQTYPDKPSRVPLAIHGWAHPHFP